MCRRLAGAIVAGADGRRQGASPVRQSPARGAMSAEPIRHDELQASPLRTPRAAAVAGFVFSLLLLSSLVLLRIATPGNTDRAGDWLTDPARRRAVGVALNLVPFAGIAFLWFMGVVRDRIGRHEDRFFATVFLGSGLLFVGMLFVAAAFAGGPVRSMSSSGPPGTGTLTLGRN